MPNYLKHLRLSISSAAARSLHGGDAKPIGYIGWLGYSNLGDEALYEAVAKLLRPTCLAEYSAARESLLAKVKLSGPKYFQGVLLGGGTLISPGFLRAIERALQQKLPMISFGTGAGSSGFGDVISPRLEPWQKPLQAFEMVGVRGPRSFDVLSRMGVRTVEIIGDPALTLGPSNLPPLRERPTLALNLAKDSDSNYGSGNSLCYREFANIARDHVRKGGDLLPVAFGNGDVEIIRECLVEAGLAHIPIHRPKSAAEFVDVVSGSHVLLGVRLHSVVLASVVGAVPVMVAYRDKCWDFTESIGLQDFTVNFQETAGPAIRAAYERALAEAPERRKIMFAQVQHWRKKQIEFASRVLTVFSEGKLGSEMQRSATAVLGN